MIRVHIKQTSSAKADIYVGATICPVRALWQYLAVRGSTPGPLFKLASGTPLTQFIVVMHMHRALQGAGVNAAAYNRHSFCIGVATTAAKCNIENSLIQTLGHWKSTAYLHYIKLLVNS